MEIIDSNPIRLSQPQNYRRAGLSTQGKIHLPPPKGIGGTFLSALLARRSAEQFAKIPIQSLSTWLHFCCSIQSINSTDPNRQKRYVASFGGLHAAQILLGRPDHSWSVYIPEEHALGELHVDRTTALSLRDSAQKHCVASDATLVLLLSEDDLVSAYYTNAQELASRDAGVFLGHGSLVAASLGLSFRILGGSGSPWAEEMLLDEPVNVRAVGMAWLGASEN
jgi:hypothetical protein